MCLGTDGADGEEGQAVRGDPGKNQERAVRRMPIDPAEPQVTMRGIFYPTPLEGNLVASSVADWAAESILFIAPVMSLVMVVTSLP